MKIDIELTDEQIKCLREFHNSTPYDRTKFNQAYKVLEVIDNTLMQAISHAHENKPERTRFYSGRSKLLWQIHEQDDPAIDAKSDPATSIVAQEPKSPGSVAFWNWIHKQQQQQQS